MLGERFFEFGAGFLACRKCSLLTWVQNFAETLPTVVTVRSFGEAHCSKVAVAGWETERAGAHYKAVYDKARDMTQVSSWEEIKTLTYEVEVAKNCYGNRSGFSPVPRQLDTV